MHRGPGGGSYPQCCKESDMTEMIQQACTMHSNLSQKKKKKKERKKRILIQLGESHKLQDKNTV